MAVLFICVPLTVLLKCSASRASSKLYLCLGLVPSGVASISTSYHTVLLYYCFRVKTKDRATFLSLRLPFVWEQLKNAQCVAGLPQIWIVLNLLAQVHLFSKKMYFVSDACARSKRTATAARQQRRRENNATFFQSVTDFVSSGPFVARVKGRATDRFRNRQTGRRAAPSQCPTVKLSILRVRGKVCVCVWRFVAGKPRVAYRPQGRGQSSYQGLPASVSLSPGGGV